MKKALSWLNDNLEEFLLLILLGALSLVMMAQVVMRYVFSSPMSWAEEFCRYCFVFSGTLSAGYCLKNNAIIRVDLLIKVLPKPMQIALDYLSKILTFLLYAYIFYYSFGLIRSTTSISTAMQIPMKYIYTAFPIGFGLGALRAAQDIAAYTKSLMKKESAVILEEGGKS